MELHGHNLIGGELSREGSESFQGVNPAAGAKLPPLFNTATMTEVDRAVRSANSAAPAYSLIGASDRAGFLDRVAQELMDLGDEWIERAHLETALPETRLRGERIRTVNQFRMFAEVVREGSWVDARIDRALPTRKPTPRPDLRRMLIPIGPVAVFGASNFPFAYSVAGGDTASALAAGNPVVVKAHPAHPGASEMAAAAILRAAEATGMPRGIFSMLHGGVEAGLALVKHPLLQAVGFTGSLAGGRALFDAAAARERPIPVYAEMGSINPVFILPGALAERGSAIAEGLAQSVTLGVGQFCTNPGIVVGIQGPALHRLIEEMAERISATEPATMLHAGICQAYARGLERLQQTTGVRLESRLSPEEKSNLAQAPAALFSTVAKSFLAKDALATENFGPSSLAVICSTPEEMTAVARRMEGQLTASIHGTAEELRENRELVRLLQTKVGRLIINGFPTGVEVSPAMQHGGPYPATTDSRSTSVGTAAITRFARPICYQDFPQELLPVELQDQNERGIWRLVEGVWGKV